MKRFFFVLNYFKHRTVGQAIEIVLHVAEGENIWHKFQSSTKFNTIVLWCLYGMSRPNTSNVLLDFLFLLHPFFKPIFFSNGIGQSCFTHRLKGTHRFLSSPGLNHSSAQNVFDSKSPKGKHKSNFKLEFVC